MLRVGSRHTPLYPGRGGFLLDPEHCTASQAPEDVIAAATAIAAAAGNRWAGRGDRHGRCCLALYWSLTELCSSALLT